MTNRRTFIKNISLLGLATPLLNKKDLFSFDRKLPAFGIQLYMVKEDMEKDTPGTLKQLGEMGYTQIESYGRVYRLHHERAHAHWFVAGCYD